MNLSRYLIVDRKGNARVTVNLPRLGPSEFAFEVNLTIPDIPEIVGSIDIELPDPPPCPDPQVHIVEIEQPAGDPDE